MKNSHVKWTGLAERLTIQEAARLVAKETGKSFDYTISFLMDCADQGYFTADVVAHSDYANVSHISRVDSSKSTVSTAELIEWLDGEIEEAHQRAREALASKESRKWGYPVKPDDVRVHLIPWSEQFDDLSLDDTISMTTRNWIEYLTQEIAERQGWAGAEREAKCAVVRAEYLNLFVALANTLPLVQELTRAPWKGAKLLPDWLTNLHLVKGELREWAKIHAPEIAKSRLFAEPNATNPHTPPTDVAAEAALMPAWQMGEAATDDIGDVWQTMARRIADECFDRDTANDCRDSLKGYAARVMEEMQKRRIHGPRGRIDNANTIQREALQGDKWWAQKSK
ncbi:hypothetical protein [Paraburkholderia sp. BL21I4N1]|uniref:hypothetical protein n=1 Tax=Paraburkholderia sp. BL21I4N1 TaxID=1938801 RepID=UPI000CFA8BA4|nr:hypothetical protein [Paraburkholderia sp. BL21I4N1]PQV52928.1 hypothetical protein B0G83_1028 [Paraburkholderia sp. BL21I4N1]